MGKDNKEEKRGRKKIPIDWNKVDKYLEAGANGVQTAAAMGVSYDTLVRRFEDRKLSNFADFADYITHKRSKGDADLLMEQHLQAINGCKTMLVWKGKSRLGQMETKEINHKGNALPPINIINASEKNNDSGE